MSTFLSPRPQFFVDNLGRRFIDPQGSSLGTPGPLGRRRITSALPTNGTGPVQLAPGIVLPLIDADGVVVGEKAPLWISRMVTATITEDTRRL